MKIIPKIHITMYLHPGIYEDSEPVVAAITYKNNKPTTTVNPYRLINGPLSEYGQELEPPIQAEYDEFIEDCVWLVENAGFTVIKRERSTDSKKSEYLIIFGMNDEHCGSIVFDLRISDHPFHATFPEELKDEVLKYLQMNKILDETATKAGINFQVEKVTIGSVKYDTWQRAFNRLADKLDQMRNKVRKASKQS